MQQVWPQNRRKSIENGEEKTIFLGKNNEVSAEFILFSAEFFQYSAEKNRFSAEKFEKKGENKGSGAEIFHSSAEKNR